MRSVAPVAAACGPGKIAAGGAKCRHYRRPDMSLVPQTFSILIEPHGWRFDTDGSLPLVAAAKLAGMALPAMCRNGTCRVCMCKMAHGQVHYRTAWPGLSPEEKLDGYILPCVAYPDTDVVIDVPDATWSTSANASPGA